MTTWARRVPHVAAGAAVLLAAHDCVLTLNRCSGASMRPTLNPAPPGARVGAGAGGTGDVVLTAAWRATLKAFRRGDVVTLRSPEASDGRRLVKRLVGLEGDWVKTAAGEFVYLTAGSCWVEGDNRSGALSSRDSNEFGPVPVACLTGAVTHVVWPPARAGPVARGLPRAMGARRLAHILHGPEVLQDDFLWQRRPTPG